MKRGFLDVASTSLVMSFLGDRLAGYQANASPLVANRIVEHVISFVLMIPDEGVLMGVLLVQTRWVATSLVDRVGINGPMV